MKRKTFTLTLFLLLLPWCGLYAMDEGRLDLNGAGVGHAAAVRVLTRDEKLRRNALRHVIKAKHERVKGVRVLTRDEKLRKNALEHVIKAKHERAKAARVLTREEKLRRSALRYMRRAKRHRMAQTVSNTSVSPEELLPLSDKKTEPQFFFILHRLPMMPVGAGLKIPTKI